MANTKLHGYGISWVYGAITFKVHHIYGGVHNHFMDLGSFSNVGTKIPVFSLTWASGPGLPYYFLLIVMFIKSSNSCCLTTMRYWKWSLLPQWLLPTDFQGTLLTFSVNAFHDHLFVKSFPQKNYDLPLVNIFF